MALRGIGGTVTIEDEEIPVAAAPAELPASGPQRDEPARVTLAELRLLFAERDQQWRDHAESLQRQIDLLTAQVQLQSQRKPPVWRMKASCLDDGSIDELVAVPGAQ